MRKRSIIVLQPALPAYRLDFFRRLAAHHGGRFRVFYSPADMGALTASRETEPWERQIGPMLHPVRGVEWQVGALSVAINRGDAVVICGAPRAISTLLFLAKARLRGAHTIWWGHYWSATSNRFRQRLRLLIAHLADALLFYTDEEVARFYADGWQHRGSIGALNNGVNLEAIGSLRASYNAIDRGAEILFLGRVTEKANLQLLLDSLSYSRLSDVRLHVVGSGENEGELRAHAVEIDVADRISWHGGTTDETRIAEIANRCAAFAYPGQVGLSLVHAMGYGLPCIVHDDPLRHMPEIAAFRNGKTGLSFVRDSAESLAASIANLLSAPETANEMSCESIRVVQGAFNTRSMAARFNDFMDLSLRQAGKEP